MAAEAEHGHRDERVGGFESERDSGEGTNSIIQAAKARAPGLPQQNQMITMIYLIAGKLPNRGEATRDRLPHRLPRFSDCA